ncbi:MAG: endonuclease/exonuclease/phosphatase family protein [Bernardetiaceae bacterium]|nr:endonuclease/exonuclease/phosphatase family protein [Bernardetiaceae bacterium]
MQKIISVIWISLLLMSSLGACNGNKESSKEANNNSQTENNISITEQNAGRKSDTEAQPRAAIGQKVSVAFYNVENLFDIFDDPKTKDEDFTPEGKLRWTEKRYQEKLQRLAEVIHQLGDEDGPEIIGLCEIENRKVLEDLIKEPLLANYQYGIAHEDSPDARGIDVALLYKKDIFDKKAHKVHKVSYPDARFRTRDILEVSGELSGEMMHFIICHFPSRRGGEQASEPKRVAAAETVKKVKQNILNQDPQAKILIMGDFNDEPHNRSIKEILKAEANIDALLYNPFAQLKKDGLGTYNYKGDWNMLDQIILSKAFQSGSGWTFEKANIYKPEKIQDTHPKYKGNPFRSYAGTKYLGGYSDHFPIYVHLKNK